MTSKTVWKFPLKVDDEQIVELPANAHILCVQTQYEKPCLWALVVPANPPEQRKILMTGTGHSREDLGGFAQYLGTFQLAQGQLVFHVFEDIIYGSLPPSEELLATATTTVRATE